MKILTQYIVFSLCAFFFQIRKSRDAQMKAYRCEFAVKSLKKSMDKCSEQTKKLQPKVEELLVDFHYKIT